MSDLTVFLQTITFTQNESIVEIAQECTKNKITLQELQQYMKLPNGFEYVYKIFKDTLGVSSLLSTRICCGLQQLIKSSISNNESISKSCTDSIASTNTYTYDIDTNSGKQKRYQSGVDLTETKFNSLSGMMPK